MKKLNLIESFEIPLIMIDKVELLEATEVLKNGYNVTGNLKLISLSSEIENKVSKVATATIETSDGVFILDEENESPKIKEDLESTKLRITEIAEKMQILSFDFLVIDCIFDSVGVIKKINVNIYDYKN